MVFIVVIPLQMKGFYNSTTSALNGTITGCHTSPNERLLQHFDRAHFIVKFVVVIPLQMKGFYNNE